MENIPDPKYKIGDVEVGLNEFCINHEYHKVEEVGIFGETKTCPFCYHKSNLNIKKLN